jgi:hypothetical protein
MTFVDNQPMQLTKRRYKIQETPTLRLTELLYEFLGTADFSALKIFVFCKHPVITDSRKAQHKLAPQANIQPTAWIVFMTCNFRHCFALTNS